MSKRRAKKQENQADLAARNEGYANLIGGLKQPDQWARELQFYGDWSRELHQPFEDGAEQFDMVKDPEVRCRPALRKDLTFIHNPTRRIFRDYQADENALATLKDLPGEGETLHAFIGGRFAMWEIVPAILARTGQRITDLSIATLSYAKENASELIQLVKSGHIGRVTLIVSYYFKIQNRQLYDSLVPWLLDNGHNVTATRTHCKIILAKMADQTCYTIEASANLRSCRAIEQFNMTRHVGLYEFRRQWFDEEQIRPAKKTTKEEPNAIDED